MDLRKKVITVLNNPKQALPAVGVFLLQCIAAFNNALVDLGRRREPAPTGSVAFDEILKRSQRRTDISDHLAILFVETVPVRPSLIVELGVREGESTFALERAAELFGSTLVSVDIDNCSRVSQYTKWMFVKSDDIAFAEHFAEWCGEHQLNPSIDVLFVDTSHEYEHTLAELARWLPLLSSRCKVFFHDTNMMKLYRRKDGSKGVGWNNNRGVIAAIEKCLGQTFDERKDFIAFAGDWLVKHHSICSGLTILERWQNNGTFAPCVSSDSNDGEAANRPKWLSCNAS